MKELSTNSDSKVRSLVTIFAKFKIDEESEILLNLAIDNNIEVRKVFVHRLMYDPYYEIDKLIRGTLEEGTSSKVYQILNSLVYDADEEIRYKISFVVGKEPLFFSEFIDELANDSNASVLKSLKSRLMVSDDFGRLSYLKENYDLSDLNDEEIANIDWIYSIIEKIS